MRYFNVEAVPYHTGASLEGLRRQGARLARHWDVPFVDRTVERD
jgi:hypothetical protein